MIRADADVAQMSYRLRLINRFFSIAMTMGQKTVNSTRANVMRGPRLVVFTLEEGRVYQGFRRQGRAVA